MFAGGTRAKFGPGFGSRKEAIAITYIARATAARETAADSATRQSLVSRLSALFVQGVALKK
jgi:hypothetical protein